MSWTVRKVGHEELTIGVAEIVGKQRPRNSSFRGITRTYTPPKTHEAEDRIKAAFLRHVGARWSDYAGEVRLRVVYWRCLAKSNAKRWAGRADLGKPDCDNVLKLVMDALIGTAYVEDSQITYASVRKMPRLPFTAGNHIKITVDYYDETYSKEPK